MGPRGEVNKGLSGAARRVWEAEQRKRLQEGLDRKAKIERANRQRLAQIARVTVK